MNKGIVFCAIAVIAIGTHGLALLAYRAGFYAGVATGAATACCARAYGGER